jgi:hypothetical protein
MNAWNLNTPTTPNNKKTLTTFDSRFCVVVGEENLGRKEQREIFLKCWDN